MSTDIHYENGTLTVTRVYEAPREDVFEAWIETSKVQQWWGCAQTTRVESQIEPKVGGKYFHMMTIEGAGDHPVDGTITEFDPPARLAYTAPNPPGFPPSTVSVTFTDEGGKTTVKLVHEGIPDEFSQFVQGGWGAALEKLDKFLTAPA